MFSIFSIIVRSLEKTLNFNNILTHGNNKRDSSTRNKSSDKLQIFVILSSSYTILFFFEFPWNSLNI